MVFYLYLITPIYVFCLPFSGMVTPGTYWKSQACSAQRTTCVQWPQFPFLFFVTPALVTLKLGESLAKQHCWCFLSCWCGDIRGAALPPPTPPQPPAHGPPLGTPWPSCFLLFLTGSHFEPTAPVLFLTLSISGDLLKITNL